MSRTTHERIRAVRRAGGANNLAWMFLVHALESYKSGAHQNGVMQGIVAALSEQDTVDVAAYCASQSGALKTTQE